MNCLKDNRQHQWNNAKFIVDKNVSLKPMLNQTIPRMWRLLQCSGLEIETMTLKGELKPHND